MDFPDPNVLTSLATAYATALSTGLAAIQWMKSRLNIDTTYIFYDTIDLHDEIILANLGNKPVLISRFTLFWEPLLLSARPKIDVTPEEHSSFRIPSHEFYTLYFMDMDKFEWGHEIRRGRKLVLSLHIFGRKRPKRLIIAAGPWARR